ncbi:MAG: hypothetical protein A2Z16_14955 [Chloroflexi bacterium RBG_16_54_18]|nr:MAG: hypothetical protein A2Z16_14955 [Chloroflexi bacterium RBG_16_54_18]
MSKSNGFSNYSQRGAYHWRQISRSIRDHNVFVSARYHKILDRLGDLNGKTVLDVGGGDGALSYLLTRKNGLPLVIDISFQALQYARAEFKKRRIFIECLQGSADKLPFSDETFDAVVGCEVIEHLSNPDQFLCECSRILRTEGLLVLTTPLRITEHPSHANHEREFFAGELRGSLENYFSMVRVDSFAPVFWFEIINFRPKLFMNRPVFLYFLNIIELWFGKNLLMGSLPYRYQSCLIGSAIKIPR